MDTAFLTVMSSPTQLHKTIVYRMRVCFRKDSPVVSIKIFNLPSLLPYYTGKNFRSMQFFIIKILLHLKVVVKRTATLQAFLRASHQLYLKIQSLLVIVSP